MAMSHADCTHPRTPAARRACRGGVKMTPERRLAESAGLVRPIARIITEEDRDRMSPGKHPGRVRQEQRRERIQPRRSGARVAIDVSGCVQAALHTGRGKCACGWENWDVA